MCSFGPLFPQYQSLMLQVIDPSLENREGNGEQSNRHGAPWTGCRQAGYITMWCWTYYSTKKAYSRYYFLRSVLLRSICLRVSGY